MKAILKMGLLSGMLEIPSIRPTLFIPVMENMTMYTHELQEYAKEDGIKVMEFEYDTREITGGIEVVHYRFARMKP